MYYQDRTLTCADCGADFIFTSGEQEFHASKGFTSEPRRCPDCRRARKADRGGDSGRSSGGFGGGSPFGGGTSGGFGASRPRQMFDAVCAECGVDTKVPFQPTGSRPVYCSDCFSKQGGGGSRGGGFGGGGGSRGGGSRGGGFGGGRDRDRW